MRMIYRTSFVILALAAPTVVHAGHYALHCDVYKTTNIYYTSGRIVVSPTTFTTTIIEFLGNGYVMLKTTFRDAVTTSRRTVVISDYSYIINTIRGTPYEIEENINIDRQTGKYTGVSLLSGHDEVDQLNSVGTCHQITMRPKL